MRFALRYSAAILGCLSVVLSVHRAYGLPAHRMVSIGEKLTPDAARLDKGRSPRTLIVYDTNTWVEIHSRLLKTLRQDGHRISQHLLVPTKRVFPALVDVDDNLLFDTLILSLSNSSSAHVVSSLSTKLTQFRERLGNVVILGLSEPRVLQSFLERIGILPRKLPRVRDYLHRVGANLTDILGRQSAVSVSVLSAHVSAATVAFQGSPLVFDHRNALPFSFLEGNPSAWVDTPMDILSGSQLVLVAGHQSRENSRAVITLSSSLCSDRLITANSGNLPFCRELIQWGSQQRGVVDWSNLHHERLSPRSHENLYTINEDLRFSIDLHELQVNSNTNGSTVISSWGPVSAGDRVQLEFTMIDPHWRLFFNVSHKAAVSPLKLIFKCPDRYGIFKSVVKLTVKGISFIHLETLTPVRNYRHNDYERFIWCAVPYYMSTFIVLLLVVIVAARLIMQPSVSKKRVD